MIATCPECGWSIEVEDEEDAADMLELHTMVKLFRSVAPC